MAFLGEKNSFIFQNDGLNSGEDWVRDICDVLRFDWDSLHVQMDGICREEEVEETCEWIPWTESCPSPRRK
jgi:hypothetical protein